MIPRIALFGGMHVIYLLATNLLWSTAAALGVCLKKTTSLVHLIQFIRLASNAFVSNSTAIQI